jgi:arsenite methyltransferase
MVASVELPPEIREDLTLHSACVSGALEVDELQGILEEAGFQQIRIKPKDESRQFITKWTPGIPIEDFVISASIEAIK